MHLWLEQLETLEAISQNEDARRLFLRMAQMSQAGAIDSFLVQLENGDLDDETRDGLAELATDKSFLLGFDDYIRRTRLVH